LKESKKVSVVKRYTMFMDCRAQDWKMFILSKFIFRFSAILMKNSRKFCLMKTEKLVPYFMKCKGLRAVKPILKNKIGGLR
jgi:hypothetical protein